MWSETPEVRILLDLISIFQSNSAPQAGPGGLGDKLYLSTSPSMCLSVPWHSADRTCSVNASGIK